MKITLINHASVLIEKDEFCFLSDPWYFGEVFNESWALEFNTPEKEIEKALNKTTHLYISHEHPDHLHFPTLKKIVNKFKKKIILYIQDLPRKEVKNALKKIGFENIVEVQHRRLIKLTDSISLYLYSVFPVDSACALIETNKNGKKKVILNCNDTELSNYDLRKIKSDLKKVDVILNQFSFATYNGNPDYENQTKIQREHMIKSYIKEQKFFEADFSIPFASFSYFCTKDNFILNKNKTNLAFLKKQLNLNNLKSCFLLPGDSFDLNKPNNFKEKELNEFEKFKNLKIKSDYKTLTEEELSKSFYSCINHLNSCFPKFIVKFIKNFIIFCPDIETYIEINFKNKTFKKFDYKIKPDLIIYSQPLGYALAHSWGLNSLTIGGRLITLNKQKRLFLFRTLMALSNSNIKLKLNINSLKSFKYLFKNLIRISFQAFAQIESIFVYTQEYNKSVDEFLKK